MCDDISRSVSGLARYLRNKHEEPVYLHGRIIPDAFLMVQRIRRMPDLQIPLFFLEKLSAWNQPVWRCFIMHFESLVSDGVAKQADLEILKKLSPCPEHRG